MRSGTTGLLWLFGDHPSPCSGQALGSTNRVANGDARPTSLFPDYFSFNCVSPIKYIFVIKFSRNLFGGIERW